MASGVSVADECLTTFRGLKLGNTLKLAEKPTYIIYSLSKDLKEVVVESSGSSDYETFLGKLPSDECRWAVYDFEFEFEKDGKRNKLCFISWSPDDAKIKSKMVYASSREALRRRLDGIAVEIQGTDSTEVSYETVLAKARSGTR